METRKHRKKLVTAAILAAAIAAILLALPLIISVVGKLFTAQETKLRTDWSTQEGDTIGTNETYQIEYAQTELGEGVTVLELVPEDIEEEGFTFYDTAVQNRLSGALEELKNGAVSWTAEQPLMVLNPFGTGSNGLYLYFQTDRQTKVTYTIHVDKDAIPDYTATAAETGGQNYAKIHEFQMIGLVPGETNQVTMEIIGSWGTVRQRVSFTVDMPETVSGYPTRLEMTEGTSTQELEDGLFAMMRVNGYLGYDFLFDNSGVLRYEMVLEGFGNDRILFDGDTMITCVSAQKLARINGLGQVEQVCELGNYDLHHDIGFGREGEILALAEENGGETVEDKLLSIDAQTGAVTLLIDFTQVLPDYFSTTREIKTTDDMFWQAGEWDWIHLNSLQYLEEDDSLIVSSRETSTILKLKSVHSDLELDWLCGDDRFWEDTPYASYSLQQEGDFVPQYGQHCVEYLKPGDTDGVYYLAMYNNNYWSLNSRDGYEPEIADSVSRSMYGEKGDASQLYVYQIDENARTFSLEQSFDVPYSSFVSNASVFGEREHWVVNSGVANVFCEYDARGKLIRQYAYTCTMQNYRTFKYNFVGVWFQS